jgi:hypothetical protein
MNTTGVRGLQKLSLGFICGALLLPGVLLADLPPAPGNLRATFLPAEVLLSWDGSADVAYYRIYRADLDRRWMPIADHVAVPRYRDGDFRSLPCYYQISAFNAAGESATSPEFLVSNAVASSFPSIVLKGINPRPVSDTAFAVSWYMSGGVGDGLLELGTSPTNYQWSSPLPNRSWIQELMITNLAPETTYYYRLTSADTNGVGFTYWNSFATRQFVEPLSVVPIPTPDGLPLVVNLDEDIPMRMMFSADYSLGAGVSYFFVQPPFIASGWLSGTLPDLLYAPAPDKSDPNYPLDIFEVSATDGVKTNSTTVELQIQPVHDAPIAADQSVTIFEDQGIKINVLATAIDAWPQALSYFVVNTTTNGALTHPAFEAAGVFQYIPNTNFNGIDHFTFAATDGESTGNVATVRIRVLPVNDPPVASNQTIIVSRSTTTNILLNASDPDNEPLLFTIVRGTSHGTLSGPTVNMVGQVFYTPSARDTNNTDSFNYSVSDGLLTATATVTIQLVPVYYPPVANNLSILTDSNQAAAITLSGSVVGGAPLTYLVVTGPAHGTLSGTSPNLTYTPAPGFVGADSITFVASDGRAYSAPGTVSISVLVPAPPKAPSGLTATAVSSSQIDLAWVDNSWNEAGFQIERSNDNRTWKILGTTAPNVRSYSNTGLTGNKTYSYRVRAFNRVGASDYSNIVSTKTLK